MKVGGGGKNFLITKVYTEAIYTVYTTVYTSTVNSPPPLLNPKPPPIEGWSEKGGGSCEIRRRVDKSKGFRGVGGCVESGVGRGCALWIRGGG